MDITCECGRDHKEIIESTDDGGVTGWHVGNQCSFCMEEDSELEGLKNQEPVATKLVPDPFDEKDGVYFSHKDWKKLEALPVGSKLYAHPVQPAVPDGWQLVPKEPTEEMLDEARYSRECPVSGSDKSRDIYIAMLSAAPKEK